MSYNFELGKRKTHNINLKLLEKGVNNNNNSKSKRKRSRKCEILE